MVPGVGVASSSIFAHGGRALEALRGVLGGDGLVHDEEQLNGDGD